MKVICLLLLDHFLIFLCCISPSFCCFPATRAWFAQTISSQRTYVLYVCSYVVWLDAFSESLNVSVQSTCHTLTISDLWLRGFDLSSATFYRMSVWNGSLCSLFTFFSHLMLEIVKMMPLNRNLELPCLKMIN